VGLQIMATFTGDVYVLQGDTEMRCNALVVSYEKETGTRTGNANALVGLLNWNVMALNRRAFRIAH
jgi:lipopolysaccharide export system protein LptA